MIKHLYRSLTWPEARERAREGAVIVIPVAAIEQHGYHLPVDVDNLLVEHVTEEAARRSEGRILTVPMIHYGFNEHNMGFPGTISVREYVFIDYCYDVAHSFVRQGFDRIVFVNGHGSNQMLCNLAARRINNTTAALAGALLRTGRLPEKRWTACVNRSFRAAWRTLASSRHPSTCILNQILWI